jgi:hypothetical protein
VLSSVLTADACEELIVAFDDKPASSARSVWVRALRVGTYRY